MPSPATTLDGEVVLRFASAEVPCEPQYTPYGLERLREIVEERPGSAQAQAAAQVLASMPDLSDGAAVHRWLLNARKGQQRWLIERELDSWLEAARAHSNLYTGRSCGCLRSAWARYLERVNELLGDIKADAGTAMWRTTRSGIAVCDTYGPLRPEDLSHAVGAGAYGFTAVRLARIKNLAMSLRTFRTPEGRRGVEVTWGTGRRAVTVLLESLTELEGATARAIASGPFPVRRDAGSWMATWPSGLLELITAWRRRPVQAQESLASAVREFLDAGFERLTPTGHRVALQLAPQWLATPTELLTAAAAIAAGSEL